MMLYSDEIKDYAAHTATINAAYAIAHDYDFMLVRAELQKNSDDARKFDHAVIHLPL
jgi:hypothetical protein